MKKFFTILGGTAFMLALVGFVWLYFDRMPQARVVSSTFDSREPQLEVLAETPRSTTDPKSLPVTNGKATSLPRPSYPLSAKEYNAEGKVDVEIMIDENGFIIQANAISGPKLLHSSAEAAALDSKFNPTYLGETAVKVSGLISYNYKLGNY